MSQNLKFRNLFGEKPHKTFFEGIEFQQYPSEDTSLKGNHKWIALPFSSNGGGILCVLNINDSKKVTKE